VEKAAFVTVIFVGVCTVLLILFGKLSALG
jgi:hypothetical protein